MNYKCVVHLRYRRYTVRMATPTSIPLPVLTWDEHPFACKGCRTVLLYVHQTLRAGMFRACITEVVFVSNSMKANHRARVHLRDREVVFQLENSTERSRVDLTAGTFLDELAFPLDIECHVCGHRLSRGLGRRRFDKLLAGDDPIRI